MRNFKLTLEYDGTDFFGWQVQPDRRTVQGEISTAFQELSREPVKVVGAGRTDAGVHAIRQVANASLDTRLGPDVLRRALNAKLPPDIRVREVAEVPLSFNARFDAKSRTYDYLFIRRPSALWWRYFLLVEDELEVASMRRAVQKLIGEQDFSSFASSADTCVSKRCNVMRAELTGIMPLLVFTITADHFLHHMVRTIAGTLLEIGRGKSLHIGEILEKRNRSAAGPTLPPHALYLMDIHYRSPGAPTR